MTFLKDKIIYLVLFFMLTFFLQGILKLPVIDRDEARFATASKTMLKTQDYVDIRMDDEPRYKKPIGIYWAQVLSNYVFGSKPYDKIWVYRLPSLIGIIFSFFLINHFITSVYNQRTALLSVLLLALSFLTISEIHQAKTDGLLFLTIVTCNLLIFSGIKKNLLSFHNKIIFWSILGLGVLIKGPIILVFVVLPILLLSIIKKKNYFNLVWNYFGFSLFLLISIPWFVLITIETNGMFWHESLVNDFFNKVRSGQESHGFYPGYYAVLIFLFFWPGSIFLPSLIIDLKNKWKLQIINDPKNLFLLCWLCLPFLVYEFIPTKLPHYVYPSYAALSILISKMLDETKLSNENLKYSFFPLIFFPLIIVTVFIFAVYEYSNINITFLFIILILIFIFFLILFFYRKKNLKKLLTTIFFFQITLYLSLVHFLIPKLEKFWISEKINQIIEIRKLNYDEIYHHGFNEPSLKFLTSHKTKKLEASKFLGNELSKKKILLIISKEYNPTTKIDERFNDFKLIDQFIGFNYSRGKSILVKILEN